MSRRQECLYGFLIVGRGCAFKVDRLNTSTGVTSARGSAVSIMMRKQPMIGTPVNQPVAHRRTALRLAITSLLACAAGTVSYMSQALPVIPQATGYGMDTP